MSKIDIEQFRNAVKQNKSNYKRLFLKLKKKKKGQVGFVINDLHEEVFKEIDCLECANCCKTTPPLITNQDINRISKFLRIKTSDFIDDYLKIDEDNDYVFKVTPCVFLDTDNYCSIYEVRPKACREYPHTDSRKISLNLMKKNLEICPAVFEIVERLDK